MVLGFTFPGQGSQRPGMGAPWVDHPSFELVAQASEVAGIDVADLLLEADQATLTRTDRAQLATFVLSLIVLDAAERVGIVPALCAGHSLGEYSALVAAGCLELEGGLHVVSERGSAMLEAAEQRPGTMVAVIGLENDGVESACRRAEGEAWVANFNAPGQVVIAGSVEDVARAGELAKALGAKRVIQMPVGGAFHTPFMEPARDRLRKALSETTFHPLEPAVVANVDARLHDDAAEWPGLLSSQLCSPVRWRQSLETMYAEGVRTFVELGPGGVLSGLARRVLVSDETVAVAVATPADLDKLVGILAGGTLGGAGEQRAGEHFNMTERVVVAPSAGLFEPVPGLGGYLPGDDRSAARRVEIEVGGLVGTVGDTEVRSAFAGTLEGVLVLAGERVTAGQPVAWLRTTIGPPGTKAR